MTHRLPRAVHGNGHGTFEEHGREVPAERSEVETVLQVVQRAAADLLARSPQPPSTLNVRVGDVAVEMGWTAPTAAAVAPVAPIVTPVAVAAPAGPTLDAATVGTFYRSSSPGAPPFVSEGDEVGPGQQVAIIEAMKLMLPVEAERGGRIVEVLVGDGEGVEFGQPLFRLAVADNDLAA
jgi:acetyl-CoA carboxylase biotin carboxyl carrier protein